MIAFVKALRARLAGDLALMTIVGTKVFWNRALTDTVMPYITIALQPTMDITRTTGSVQVEWRGFQVQAFSLDAEQAGTLIELVEKALEEPLVLEEGANLEVTKSSDWLDTDPELTEDNLPVHFGTFLGQAAVQRDRTV